MSWNFLKNNDLKAFLTELANGSELFITKKENGKWKFKKYEDKENPKFAPNLIDEALKQFFFPKRRPIATFDLKQKWSMKPVEINQNPRIIMGLHACDAAGIDYLDQVFMLNDYKDVLYEAERNRTTLIGHICSEMGKYCHCTDRGITPEDTSNFDVVFTEIENGFIFKGITEKGKKLMQSKLLIETDTKPTVKKWEKDRYSSVSVTREDTENL